MREEIPFYKNISGDINPARQKTLGLRLVISSQIYASRDTSKNLAAWDDYAKARSTPALPAQSNLSAYCGQHVLMFPFEFGDVRKIFSPKSVIHLRIQ